MRHLFFIIIFCVFSGLACAQSAQQKGAGGIAVKNNEGITIKDNAIYSDGTQIGTFKKKIIDKELTSVVVYNMSRSRVAEVTYAAGDENWTIATPVDQNKMYCRHEKEHPLEALFQYIVDKKYL